MLVLDDDGLLRGLEDDRVVVVLRVEVVGARRRTDHLQQDLAKLLVLKFQQQQTLVITDVLKKLDRFT